MILFFLVFFVSFSLLCLSFLMKFHLCFVSSAILPFLCFCTDTLCSWNDRWFSLVTFPFAQALPCVNVHYDRLLVPLLLCSAFSSTHPDSIGVEVTMHICCMAQAVASKTLGSVVLSALPSYAYLTLPGHRDTRAPHYAVARQHEHRE